MQPGASEKLKPWDCTWTAFLKMPISETALKTSRAADAPIPANGPSQKSETSGPAAFTPEHSRRPSGFRTGAFLLSRKSRAFPEIAIFPAAGFRQAGNTRTK
ncbi:hypothetical protein C5O15_01155 [Akkermansia muciniphila]|nr:hypothetical protein C5O15_01155 [Akkermansia muciniphila]